MGVSARIKNHLHRIVFHGRAKMTEWKEASCCLGKDCDLILGIDFWSSYEQRGDDIARFQYNFGGGRVLIVKNVSVLDSMLACH